MIECGDEVRSSKPKYRSPRDFNASLTLDALDTVENDAFPDTPA
jgi:hypothetical protein